MSYRFIVNPGDYQDVIITDKFSATDLYVNNPGARLYRCSRQQKMSGHKFIWEEYQGGLWNQTNRDNLPVKVLEAGEK